MSLNVEFIYDFGSPNSYLVDRALRGIGDARVLEDNPGVQLAQRQNRHHVSGTVFGQ